MPGKINAADIFTKEDNDVGHFTYVRDKTLLPREEFGFDFGPQDQVHSLHPRGVLRIQDSREEELINTNLNIGGKGKLPHHVDESEPFNFGSFSQPLIATE